MNHYTREYTQPTHLGPALVIRGALFMSLLLLILFSQLSSGVALAEGEVAKAPAVEITQTEPTPEPAAASQGGCEVSQAFPDKVRRWCEPITRHAQSNELPPDLIAALIWQESGGNPSAYSHSGAVGLMQVMPRDGIAANFVCQNGPCFASRPTIQELEDPEFNIEYGTRMLAGLVKRFGSLRDGLKAYGPMDVGYAYADIVLGLYQDYQED